MRNQDSEHLEFEFTEMKAQTNDAWLLEAEGEPTWFPKSICELEPERDVVLVPKWLAVEKGLL